MHKMRRILRDTESTHSHVVPLSSAEAFCFTMDYLRMDGKQYASKGRNKALEDFDWLSQWLE